MHSVELTNGVPAFLIKLWKLVEDPASSDLICWSPNGLSFIIHDQMKFAKELLPLYFKHNNMASFIRQLNMYGFRKVMNVEPGRLRSGECENLEFYHQYFLKGKINLLEFIKRKVSTSRNAVIPSSAANNASYNKEEGVSPPTESVQEIMSTMSTLKTKQEGVDSQLQSMKQENEALWREVAYLRQKHIKQQQIVDKLIHFLVSLVQPKRNISVKRKMPLMIHDSSELPRTKKAPRLSRQFSKNNSVSLCSPKGPVIHDVTDFLTSSPQPVSSPGIEEEESVTTVSPVIHIASPEEVFVHSPLGTDEHLEPLSVLDPLQNIEPVIPEESASLGENTDDNSSKVFSVMNSNSDSVDPVPASSTSEPPADEPNVGNSDEQKKENHMQVSLVDNPLFSNSLNTFCGLESSKPRDLLNDHLDGVESDLSWLQEQLSNGTAFNLDTSALLGLFSSDDPVSGSSLPNEPVSFLGNEVSGNELTQYVPSLLDLQSIDDELTPESPGTSADDLHDLLRTTLDTPCIELLDPFSGNHQS